MLDHIKKVNGSTQLEECLELFRVKRELGLTKSGFSNPLLIVGESGIGKSQIVESFAKKKKYIFVKFDLSNVDSTTFNGLMVTVKNDSEITHYHTIPAFIKKLREECEKGNRALVFLDELNRTSYETRNAVFKLVINNEWGVDSQKLSSKIFIVAAMNPNNDEYSDTEEMDLAFLKRFVAIEYIPQLDEWLDYAVNKNIHPKIVEILQKYPYYFSHNDHTKEDGMDPRNWEDLSYALHAIDKLYHKAATKKKKMIINVLHMYAPKFAKNLEPFFEKSIHSFSVVEINNLTKDLHSPKRLPSKIVDLYTNSSIPKKFELLKDALIMFERKSISEITFASILYLSPQEVLLGVYNPLLSSINSVKRSKVFVDMTEKVDKKYSLKKFENILDEITS